MTQVAHIQYPGRSMRLEFACECGQEYVFYIDEAPELDMDVTISIGSAYDEGEAAARLERLRAALDDWHSSRSQRRITSTC